MKVLKQGRSLDLFFAELKTAKRRVLFLDYDGTLAPFQIQRNQAFPYPGVSEALKTILEADCSRLVLISGRCIKDLIPLLGLKKLPEIWGSHGWERLKPNQTCEKPEMEETAASGLTEAHKWVKAEGLLAQAELKPASLALHWRGLPEAKIQEIRRKALRDWRRLAQKAGLVLHEFDGGLELRVPGRDKGYAVQTVLAEEGKGALAAYLGDDLTDEDAFSALQGRGLKLLVRRELRPTAADIWLKPPEELLAFLHNWTLACLGQG